MVVGIPRECPKPNRLLGQIRTGMTTQRGRCHEFAGIIDRLFHAVGSVLVIVGNVSPDFNDVGQVVNLRRIGNPPIGVRWLTAAASRLSPWTAHRPVYSEFRCSLW